jgi:coenzyme PQQ precursor peptide PqqA
MPLAEGSCFALFLVVPLRCLLNPDAPAGCHEAPDNHVKQLTEETIMAWTTPTLVEICIGLEINGYLPAEF